jgi:hypothetical protein
MSRLVPDTSHYYGKLGMDNLRKIEGQVADRVQDRVELHPHVGTAGVRGAWHRLLARHSHG